MAFTMDTLLNIAYANADTTARDPTITALTTRITRMQHDSEPLVFLVNRAMAFRELGYAALAVRDARAAYAMAHKHFHPRASMHLVLAYCAAGDRAAAQNIANKLLSTSPDCQEMMTNALKYRQKHAPVLPWQILPVSEEIRRVRGFAKDIDAIRLGNDLQEKKQFRDAVHVYTLGITAYLMGFVPVLRERAARFLALGLYDCALNDVDAAARITGDEQTLIDLRVRAQALWDASLGAPIGDAVGRVACIDDRQLRASALRDLTRYAHEAITDIPLTTFCAAPLQPRANFYGPIEVRMVPGKGRGLFTTADVKAGDLLVREIALIAIDNPSGHAATTATYGLEESFIRASNCVLQGAQDLTTSNVGPGLGLPRTLLSRARARATHQVAFPQAPREAGVFIAACGIINSFSGDKSEGGAAEPGLEVANSGGIFPVSSFCNHDTCCNTAHVGFGRTTFLRAAADLPAGTELTVCYASAQSSPYHERSVRLAMTWGVNEPKRPSDLNREESERVAKLAVTLEGLILNGRLAEAVVIVREEFRKPLYRERVVDPTVGAIYWRAAECLPLVASGDEVIRMLLRAMETISSYEHACLSAFNTPLQMYDIMKQLAPGAIHLLDAELERRARLLFGRGRDVMPFLRLTLAGKKERIISKQARGGR